MLRRPDAPLGPLRLAGRYRGAPRLRSSARRDAPSPAPGCSTGSRPARPAETPGPPRFLEDPPPCMPRSRTPARRWTPGRCGVPVLPSVVSRTSALATQCFEALSRGLHGPCVRFAAWIAPRPRNTRCRLVASLGRAGLVTRRVPPKGFRAMCYIPLPPSPGFAWRKLTKDHGLTPESVFDRLAHPARRAGIARFSPPDMLRSFIFDLLDAGGVDPA